jgi:hypothetical protein
MKCEHCGHPTHKLDDWVNGKPDAWDYEAVLRDNEVTVDSLADECYEFQGHQLCWKHGFMHVPTDNEVHARKAAALFVELYLRGISASFADILMDGFLSHLELQE